MSQLMKIFLYVLYFAVVIGLIVLIVLGFRSGDTKQPPTNKPTATVQTDKPVAKAPPKQPAKPQAPATPTPSKTPVASNSAPTKTPAPATTPTSPAPAQQPTANGSSSANKQLVNTGPGSSVALFVTVSAVAGYGYRRRLLRGLS